MPLNRRDFMQLGALAATAASAGVTIGLPRLAGAPLVWDTKCRIVSA